MAGNGTDTGDGTIEQGFVPISTYGVQQALTALAYLQKANEALVNYGRRKITLQDSISETIICYVMGYAGKDPKNTSSAVTGDARRIGDNARIELKARQAPVNGPDSFGPDERFDDCVYAVFDMQNWMLTIYDLNVNYDEMGSWQITKSETVAQKRARDLRPHFSLKTWIDQLGIRPCKVIDLVELMGEVGIDAQSLLGDGVAADRYDSQVVYLPMYSENKVRGKYVPERNNLNLRFAGGRKRNPYELGLPVPASWRRTHPDFFLPVGEPMRFVLPNGNELSVKRCQQDGKSLMSNPNSALGQWVINDVLGIDVDTPITYDMLSETGIDSIRIRRSQDAETGIPLFHIGFAETGSYEKWRAEHQNG